MMQQAQTQQVLQYLMQINQTLQANPTWHAMTPQQKFDYLNGSGYLNLYRAAGIAPVGLPEFHTMLDAAVHDAQQGAPQRRGGYSGDDSAPRKRGRPRKRRDSSESSEDDRRRKGKAKSRRHAAGMSDSEASDASDSDLSDVVSDEEGKVKRQARWAYNSLKEPGLSGSEEDEEGGKKRGRGKRMAGKLQDVEEKDNDPIYMHYLKPVTTDLVKGPTYVPEDWEWRCHICGDDQTTDDNVILLCDGCNVPVHQECYGVPVVPEGDWFCDGCQASLDAKLANCAVCPHTGGALRRLKDFSRCKWHAPDEMHPSEKAALEEQQRKEAEAKGAAGQAGQAGTQSEATSGQEASNAEQPAAALPGAALGGPQGWPALQGAGVHAPALSGGDSGAPSADLAGGEDKRKRWRGQSRKPAAEPAKKPERVPKIWEEFEHLMPPKDLRQKDHVHMCCALFVTDITFGNPDKMADLSLAQMTRARMDLKCVVCGQAGGGTMQCAVGNCYKGFHVLCGRARSFVMGFRATDGHPLAFCREHSGPRYRRVRDSMLNGRKLMAAEAEEVNDEEKAEEPKMIPAAETKLTEAEAERQAQIQRNKAMMDRMFDM